MLEPFYLICYNYIAYQPISCEQAHVVKWVDERVDEGELMSENLQLTCSDCGQEFTFSTEDQAFFQERGYSTPKRCKPCRQAKKNEQDGGGRANRSASQGTAVTCSGCGKQTTVPFEPRGDRPVYCQDCYNAKKKSGGHGRDDRRPGRY